MKINPVVSKEEKKYSWWPSKVVEGEEKLDMSKKHYEVIARIMKKNQLSHKVVNDFIVLFKEDNPRFDSGKFLEACEWRTGM